MSAQGGYGVVLKISISSTLTAIVGVEDTDFPLFSKFIAESTAHDSTDGYYEAVATGKRRLNPFPCTLNWDVDQATHAAVKTAFESDDPVNMSIQDPDGDEVIAFAAHVESVGRIARQEEKYRAQVQIHPTGAPTIT